MFCKKFFHKIISLDDLLKSKIENKNQNQNGKQPKINVESCLITSALYILRRSRSKRKREEGGCAMK